MRLGDDTIASPTGDFQDRVEMSNGVGSFSFQWGPTTSDGAIVSPLLVAGLNQGICFNIQIIRSVGLDNLQVVYRDGNTLRTHLTNIDPTQTYLLCVYDCDKLCFLFDECTGCAASNCTWCDSSSKCLQSGSPEANSCSTKYSGFQCPCDRYSSSCSKCSENPNCGWCCEDGGLTGSCISGNNPTSSIDTCDGTWKYHGCAETCAVPCVRGACICGQCQCPNRWTGPTCDVLIGCDGIPDSGLEYDKCGVCGGDDSSCLGCDGIPNSGLRNDSCGECGGDGLKCYQLCPWTQCSECALTEICDWCYTGGQGSTVGSCVPKGNCTGQVEIDPETDRCQNKIIDPVILAGAISGVVVAIIVVAIIVCVVLSAAGGTKAYQMYMTNKRMMGEAQSNPMYVESTNTGTNPMFEN